MGTKQTRKKASGSLLIQATPDSHWDLRLNGEVTAASVTTKGRAGPWMLPKDGGCGGELPSCPPEPEVGTESPVCIHPGSQTRPVSGKGASSPRHDRFFPVLRKVFEK